MVQFQSLDWVDVDFDAKSRSRSRHRLGFQSLDWVDVDFDRRRRLLSLLNFCFNPSTGLMLISTPSLSRSARSYFAFQSLDWVDVDFDLPAPPSGQRQTHPFQSLDWVDVDFDHRALLRPIVARCFNPSTGLMLISTWPCQRSAPHWPVSIPRLG